MENINIREYIINNFKDEEISKIKESIETTIKYQDEDALIGLGVFFEILWHNLTNEEKDKYLNIIKHTIQTS